jgi:hypothetical protein
MSYAYTPSDVYWGQLAGSLESIYSGTTTVLDHAHMVYTAEHGELSSYPVFFLSWHAFRHDSAS